MPTFVQVLQVCYMIMLAYTLTNIENGQYWTLPIYILVLLPIMVTTEIANTMSAPFGRGLTDFNQSALLEPIRKECHTASSAPDPAFFDKIGTREWCPDIIVDPPAVLNNDEPPANGDLRRFLARYEERAQPMRARKRQLESFDRSSAHRGVLASLIGPFQGKTSGEIFANICRAMRGEWGLAKRKAASIATSKAEGDSADFSLLPGMPLPLTLGGAAYLDSGWASQRDLMEVNSADDADDAQSVSTTASVRRLNEAISELGLYMYAEISQVETTARQCHTLFHQRTILNRRLDHLEERMVQYILQWCTQLESNDGARLHPSDLFITETQDHSAPSETADAVSRKPLMQRVLEVEKKIVTGAHLPPDLSQEQVAQMHMLAVEAGLPLARAMSYRAASSTTGDGDSNAGDLGVSSQPPGARESHGAGPLRLGDLRYASAESSMMDSSCDGDSMDSPRTPVPVGDRLLPALSMSARKLPHRSPVRQELLLSQLGADRLRREASLKTPSTASGMAAAVAAAAAVSVSRSIPASVIDGRRGRERNMREEAVGQEVRGRGRPGGGAGGGGGGEGGGEGGARLAPGAGGAGNLWREPLSSSSSNARHNMLSPPPGLLKPPVPPRWEPPNSSSSLVMKPPALGDADRGRPGEECQLGWEGVGNGRARGVVAVEARGVGANRIVGRAGGAGTSGRGALSVARAEPLPESGMGRRGHVIMQLPSL